MSTYDPFKVTPGMKLAVAPGLSPRSSTGSQQGGSPGRGSPSGRGGNGGSPRGRGGRGGGNFSSPNRSPGNKNNSTPPAQAKKSQQTTSRTPPGAALAHHENKNDDDDEFRGPGSGRGFTSVPMNQSPYAMTTTPNSTLKAKMATNNTTTKKKQGRRITFKNGANEVTFVKPPPKEESKKYWFTERERTTRKPLQFNLDCNSVISVEVMMGMRVGGILAASDSSKNGNKRTYFDVRQEYLPEPEDPMHQLMMAQGHIPADLKKQMTPWGCIGSSGGKLEKLKLHLPPGTYFFRARGAGDLFIFAEAVDIERELI